MLNLVQLKAYWELWVEKIKDAPPISKDATVNQIIVPTIDTVRIQTLAQMLVTHQKAVLFVGQTGTGKSVYLNVRIYKYLVAKFQYLKNPSVFDMVEQLILLLWKNFDNNFTVTGNLCSCIDSGQFKKCLN